jgi:hypothetical protein
MSSIQPSTNPYGGKYISHLVSIHWVLLRHHESVELRRRGDYGSTLKTYLGKVENQYWAESVILGQSSTDIMLDYFTMKRKNFGLAMTVMAP